MHTLVLVFLIAAVISLGVIKGISDERAIDDRWFLIPVVLATLFVLSLVAVIWG